MKQPVVVGIGEVLWDKFPEVKKIGGAPLNFVYHAMSNGADGYVISAVGNDSLGDELVSTIKESGVKILCEKNAYPTGIVNITLDEEGVAQYEIVENVAWDHINVDEEVKKIICQCDCICFGTLAQRSSKSRVAIYEYLRALPVDAVRFYDVNLRQHYYDKTMIDMSMLAASVLKLNNEELIVIGRMFGIDGEEDEVVKSLIKRYELDYVLLTCGDAYSKVYARNGEISCVDTPAVEVVDTVGAGDSFSGTFIVSLLRGDDFREAHRKAVEVSAWVCTQSGAMPKYDIKN